MASSVVNRYYDPATDQFLSIDPDVAITDQPYVFTNDNPLNSEDPLGLDAMEFIDGPSAEEGTGTASGGTSSESSGTALARELGIEGESLAEIDQAAKVRIASLTGTADYRIPDELTDSSLLEVKNVKYLSYTSQIKDFVLYSESEDVSLKIVVRENTVLSGTIKGLIEEGKVIVVRLLPGK